VISNWKISASSTAVCPRRWPPFHLHRVATRACRPWTTPWPAWLPSTRGPESRPWWPQCVPTAPESFHFGTAPTQSISQPQCNLGTICLFYSLSYNLGLLQVRGRILTVFTTRDDLGWNTNCRNQSLWFHTYWCSWQVYSQVWDHSGSCVDCVPCRVQLTSGMHTAAPCRARSTVCLHLWTRVPYSPAIIHTDCPWVVQSLSPNVPCARTNPTV